MEKLWQQERTRVIRKKLKDGTIKEYRIIE